MIRLLFSLALLLLAGCQTARQGITLPPLPTWQQPADARVMDAFYLRTEATARLPGAKVQASDVRFTRVNHAWLEEYLTWTWQAAKAAGVTYTPESFDCEDFSLGFYFFATRAAAKAGVKAAPLVARVVVEWDARTRHELAGAVTDRGLYVIEPQPDAGPFRVWPLEQYPRRVLAVTFGDFNP